MNILAVDAGNTTTEFALYVNDEFINSYRFITKQERTNDETGFFIKSFLSMNNLSFADINDAIISSVVPDVNYTLISTFLKYMNINPIMVGPGIKTGIRIQTENPKEVGADRIVDALAAYTLYGGPIIVANFGTASRYDYIDENGVFSYAVTSPGIKISADALWTKAAKLPNIEIAKPETILASNTVTSMQAGLVYGHIGQSEYIINKIKEETHRGDTKVVACGGYAKIICPNTTAIDVYDPLLTMKGLKLLYDKNKR